MRCRQSGRDYICQVRPGKPGQGNVEVDVCAKSASKYRGKNTLQLPHKISAIYTKFLRTGLKFIVQTADANGNLARMIYE
jgi:hypothetical protein